MSDVNATESTPRTASRTGVLLAMSLALAAGWAAVPAAASADGQAVAVAEDPDVEQARELEAEAEALRDRAEDWSRAADLYREAAELRPDHDPVRVDNLRQAARLAHHQGRVERALADADAAAEAATRQGNVQAAAEAYLEAAWLSAEAGDPDLTRRYLEDARVIAESPYLSDRQRRSLLNRFSEPA